MYSSKMLVCVRLENFGFEHSENQIGGGHYFEGEDCYTLPIALSSQKVLTNYILKKERLVSISLVFYSLIYLVKKKTSDTD